MTPSAFLRAPFELRFAVPLAALALLAAMTPGKTFAATPFDGYWNVSIMTQSGACDRSYNFAVSIVDGRLDGANGALLGTVNSKGGVNVADGRRRPPRLGERPAGRKFRFGPLERQRHRLCLQRPLDRAARLISLDW